MMNMKFFKSKFIALVAILLFGAASIVTMQFIEADASKSPFEHLTGEKRELEEEQEQRANAVRALDIKKPEGNPGPDVIQKTPIPKTEILDFVDDPYKNKVMFFTNGWVTHNNGVTTSVGVGSLVEEEEQGAVLIRKFKDHSLIETKIVKTPVKEGKITIKSFNGMTLLLETEKGNELRFNVQSELFN
jgi:flavin-dependent dehydrogenase